MSIWYSQSNRSAQDSEGRPIERIIDVYTEISTDINGQFEVDITEFNFTQIIDVSGFIIGQTLSTLDIITDKLFVSVIEVTNTVIKGVIIKPTIITSISIGNSYSPIIRDNVQRPVRMRITGRR